MMLEQFRETNPEAVVYSGSGPGLTPYSSITGVYSAVPGAHASSVIHTAITRNRFFGMGEQMLTSISGKIVCDTTDRKDGLIDQFAEWPDSMSGNYQSWFFGQRIISSLLG